MEKQKNIEYTLNYRDKTLIVSPIESGHFITIVEKPHARIDETPDGWSYHEEIDLEHGEFFNIHVRPDGSFSYSNESTTTPYTSKEELWSCHQFIQEIVSFLEGLQEVIYEKEQSPDFTGQLVKSALFRDLAQWREKLNHIESDISESKEGIRQIQETLSQESMVSPSENLER